MDTLEPMGSGTPSEQPTPNPAASPAPEQVGLDTPVEAPDLEAMRRSLQADYTRKTQEVADQRRTLELQAQQIAQIQQQAANQGQAVTQQEAANLLDRLPASMRENVDANGQEFLNTIDSYVKETVGGVSEKLAALEAENGQLKQNLTAQQQQAQLDRWSKEAEQLKQEFGEDFVANNAQGITRMLSANPSMGLKEALFASSPDSVIDYVRSQTASETQKQLLGDAGDIAGLGIPAGFVEPTKPAAFSGTDSESMLESALQANGTNVVRNEVLKSLPMNF